MAVTQKKWDSLNDEQKNYAQNLGTTVENMTDRQYKILTKEKSNMWLNYQWHFGSTEWNQPIHNG